MCTLCSFEITDALHIIEEKPFCCRGCSAVYHILQAKNELHLGINHPLLKEAHRFGLISNQELIYKIEEKESLEKESFSKLLGEIEGLFCPSCATLIQLALGGQKGIYKVVVDYPTDLVSITYDPFQISKETIINLIATLGYSYKTLEENEEKKNTLFTEFIVALISSLNVMMFTTPLLFPFAIDGDDHNQTFAIGALLLSLPALLYSAYPIYKRAYTQIKWGVIATETLATTAIFSASLLSFYQIVNDRYQVYFDTITVLVTFLLLGKWLERKAKMSSKLAFQRIFRAIPRKGRLVTEGIEKFIPLKEAKVGDLFLVLKGEKIPLDGIVEEGEGSVDESLMTGESTPLHKVINSPLIAGSILLEGKLYFRSTALEKSSLIYKIVELIEGEMEKKREINNPLEKIVSYIFPLVISISFFSIFINYFLVNTVEESLMAAISVLLIACPCAIGIAIPFVESTLIQKFSELGALVKNRAIFEKLTQVTDFVFDKTGTLTNGKYQLQTDFNKISDEHQSLLKGLTAHSLHPISKAIFNSISIEGTLFKITQEVIGRGVLGSYQETNYYLGSTSFAHEHGVYPNSLSNVHFFKENELIVSLFLGDTLRPDAQLLIHELQKDYALTILSGDHLPKVEEVAKTLNITNFYANQSPLEKQQIIQSLKKEGKTVVMVGDGINDAPSLSSSDIAISLVSATDISIHVSDLLLTKDQLTTIPKLISLAKKGKKIVNQNLFFAFFYNLALIPLAAMNSLTPLLATIAMVLSSLLIILNSKRVANQEESCQDLEPLKMGLEHV